MMNITKTKSITLLMRQQHINSLARVSTCLLHTSSIQRKSIIEQAKETVMKAGETKIGQQTIHDLKEAVQTSSSMKDLGDKVQAAVNQTAENLKSDIQSKASNLDFMDEQTHHLSEQLQREKDTKLDSVKTRAEEWKKVGEEKIAEGVDRVEDAILDTSEKLGAKEQDRKQAKHRLEDEVEDAVQRLQHKRD
ncbi:hypothetical protein BC941DRAFT_433270 [Chlamydoabsidia padenii]|nr:hypothetical protein BC941DRAFT_433270 [Chlamydoabsidia padenii]